MNLFDLFVKISADTQEAERGIEAVKNKLYDLVDVAFEAASALRSVGVQIGEAFEPIEVAADSAAESIGMIADKIEDVIDAANEYSDAMNSAADGNEKVSESADKTANSSEKIGHKLKDVGDKAKKALESVAGAIKKVGEAAKAIDSAVSGVGDKIVKGFGAAAAAVGGFAVGLAKAGVEYNAQMETYEMAFTTLLGSAEEARAAMAQIQADAASTPFDVAGLTQANQLLVGAGVSAAEARDVIMALGDAVSATGGGNDELSRMAANLQQIKNVGQASAVDVKQFAMAGINIYQVLADQMGITLEEASSVKPTYEQLSAALISAASEGGRYFGAMANQSLTFNGQISNLQDNWSALLGSVTGGLQTILQGDILPRIIGYVDQIQESFNSGGFEGLASTLGEIFADALNTVLGYLPGFVTGVFDTLVSLVSSIDVGQLVAAFQEVVSTAFTAFDGIMELLAPMVEQIVPALLAAFIQYQGMLREIGVTVITAIVSGVAENSESIFATLSATVASLADVVVENLPVFLDAGMQILQTIADGLSQNAESITATASQIIGMLINGVSTALPMLLQIGGQVISMLAQAISQNLGEITNAAVEIITYLCTSFDSTGVGTFLSSAGKILGALVDALVQSLPAVASGLSEILTGIGDFFGNRDNLWAIINSAMDILLALADGLVEALPALAGAALDIIIGLVSMITDVKNLARFGEAALKILYKLADGLTTAVYRLAEPVRELMQRLADFFTSFEWTDVGQKIIDMIKNGISAAWEGLKNWFSGLINDLIDIGTNVVGGIKTGITKAWDGLKSLVRGKSESIEDTARDALETHSPSRVMMRVGHDVVDGLIVGWEDRMQTLWRIVSDDSLTVSAMAEGYLPFERSSTFAANAISRDFAPVQTGGEYTINIELDGDTIAKAIFDPLRAEARRRGESFA